MSKSTIEVCSLDFVRENIIENDDWNSLQKCYGKVKNIYNKKPYEMKWDSGKVTITQNIRTFCRTLKKIKQEENEKYKKGVIAVYLWFIGKVEIGNPLHKYLYENHKSSFEKMNTYLEELSRKMPNKNPLQNKLVSNNPSKQFRELEKKRNLNRENVRLGKILKKVKNVDKGSNENLEQENTLFRRNPNISKSFGYTLSKGDKNYKLKLDSITPDFERYYIINDKNKTIGYVSLDITKTKDTTNRLKMSPKGKIYNKDLCVGKGPCVIEESNEQPVQPLQKVQGKLEEYNKLSNSNLENISRRVMLSNMDL